MPSEGKQDQPPIKITFLTETEKVSDEPEAVAERLLKKPVVVHLFTDGPDKTFDPASLKEYLSATLGPNFTIEYHGDIVQFALNENPNNREQMIAALAKAKFAKRFERFASSPVSLTDDEKKLLETQITDRDPQTPIRAFAASQRLGKQRVLDNEYYDISLLGNAFQSLIPESMQVTDEKASHTALVVTGRGVANPEGFGIHMRGGFGSDRVSVISTTGLVEAPGEPLEVTSAYNSSLGMVHFDKEEYNQRIRKAIKDNNNVYDAELIRKSVQNELFFNRMLHHEDPRINEAVKGMALGFIIFSLGEFGKASQCSTTDLNAGTPDTTKFCRLHDSHWQEELMATQVNKAGKPEFCDYHTKLFSQLKEKH